ncbi:MAG: cob(I)yrinic acid a,c-diamide adenosyltransferase [Melioribacteraceae bacterium]|nr:cob(I)yrinic acid a,c-diamide adenosyltransferase [Melioribacteraceae bacterium]
MKIYTKTGDTGETSLFGGKRVKKNHARIEAYGTVDELNCVMGIARSFNDDDSIDKTISDIQNQLFVLGGDLATPLENEKVKINRISEFDIVNLEQMIDELSEKLPPLRNFILPGGSKTAAQIHFARTICRRAERKVYTLSELENVGIYVLRFLNRLSDFLFVFARYVNHSSNTPEIEWKN